MIMDDEKWFFLAYDYQIDSDTLQDPMPRICIQPVVESPDTWPEKCAEKRQETSDPFGTCG